MYLVVGLGNIGSEYEKTRHNVGFMVIDKILQNISSTKISKNSFKGELFKSGEFLFLKPSTYMNLSGESVSAVANFYKPNDVIVIHDDLDLKLGALRFKKGGGHGGHNGLKSIDSYIGREYHRVRIGIGKPENRDDVIKYVLGKFKEDELDCINKTIEIAEKAIFDFDDNVASKYSKKGC